LVAAQGLHSEFVFFQRDVVFQLVQAQDGAALAADVRHFQAAGGPDALDVLDVLLLETTRELIFDEIVILGGDVVIFANPNTGECVLAGFGLLGPRFDAPALYRVDGFFTGKLVLVLIDVALFEIFEAEVRGEEARGAILQCDAAFASDGGRRFEENLARRGGR